MGKVTHTCQNNNISSSTLVFDHWQKRPPTFSIAKDAPPILDATRTEGRSRHDAAASGLDDADEQVGPVHGRDPVPAAAPGIGGPHAAVLQAVAQHPIKTNEKNRIRVGNLNRCDFSRGSWNQTEKEAKWATGEDFKLGIRENCCRGQKLWRAFRAYLTLNE